MNMHLPIWQLHGMGDDVSILEESSASEDSDETELYGQQLEESKENKERWLM